MGRSREMATLHQELQRTDRMAIVAIAGMGGVGKTELAKRYATRHQTDYPGGVCWLRARAADPSVQLLELVQLRLDRKIPQEWNGQPLTIAQQVAWCWDNWQPAAGRVLLVLDDVAEESDLATCRPFLDAIPIRFRVLMTTRLRPDRSFFALPLDVLPPDKALDLLTALVGQERLARDPEMAADLCDRLGYLPLGLELVGRYLDADPDLSLAAMVTRLEMRKLADTAIDLDETQMQQQYFMTAQRGVRAAIALSWEKLAPATQDVGRLLGVFAPAVIPWALVEATAARLDWAAPTVTTAKQQLYQRYLIQSVGEGHYKLHPLIREFLREALEQSESVAAIERAFAAELAAIASEIPQATTLTDIQAVTPIEPHLRRVAQELTPALTDEDLLWAFVGLARFYDGQGLYTLAEPWFEQCLQATQARLGEAHPDVATSLNNLAELYRAQGRYAEAEPLYQQALALRQQLLGEAHPAVATSLNNLAVLYDNQGRYAEAEPLYQQALELHKQLLGEAHPDVATSLNNLAVLYDNQGRYAEAEPLYRQALALRQRLLGEDHPTVAASLNNLAALYHAQGRYAEAEPLLQEALALRQQLLGEAHPAVATSLNNLAELYRAQGRYAEAEPLYQQALALKQQLLGEEHPDVATSLNNLAALYRAQRRYAEAEPLYQQALALRQRLLGEAHPAVATSLNNLAVLYYHQGRFRAAEPLLVQALHIREHRLGADHPDTVSTRRSLDNLHQQMQLRLATLAPDNRRSGLLQRLLRMCRRVWGWLTRLWRQR